MLPVRMTPLLLAVSVLPEVALATPAEDGLAAVDAVLVTHAAARRAINGHDFCDDSGKSREGAIPGIAESRIALCSGTESIGFWELSGLRTEGGAQVKARLALRRYSSTDMALQARKLTVAQGGTASWCFHDAIWTGDLLWTFEYGCHISETHVPAVGALRAALRGLGEAYLGAVGTHGELGGTASLLNAAGLPHVVSESDRSWSYADVGGVAEDDVLWVRERPLADGKLAATVGSLGPFRTCIPVFEKADGWWQLLVDGTLG